jgi:hypothetical protein
VGAVHLELVVLGRSRRLEELHLEVLRRFLEDLEIVSIAEMHNAHILRRQIELKSKKVILTHSRRCHARCASVAWRAVEAWSTYAR